ncbi:hypothetical protein H8959_007958 [Pygathrix nigripes]
MLVGRGSCLTFGRKGMFRPFNPLTSELHFNVVATGHVWLQDAWNMAGLNCDVLQRQAARADRTASGFGGAFVSRCSRSSCSSLRCCVSSAPRGPASVAPLPAGIGRCTAKTPGPPGSLKMGPRDGRQGRILTRGTEFMNGKSFGPRGSQSPFFSIKICGSHRKNIKEFN